MNTTQLIKQLRINYDLITSNKEHAYEHLQMLKTEYTHLFNDEVLLFIELNTSAAELHFKSNYKGVLEISVAAIEKFKDSGHKHLLALHLKMVGHVYIQMGEHELAESHLLEALEHVLPGDPDYASHRALILYTLAMNLDVKEQEPERAIEYLNGALALLKDETHGQRKANCLMGLGNMYNNQEKVDEALKYYLEAAAIFEHNYFLANMASVYSNIGNCYIKLQDFEKAERYLERSLELGFKFSTPNEVSISQYNLAILYKETGDLNKAEELLIVTKNRLLEIGNKPFLEMIEIEFADLAQKRREGNANAA